MSQRDDRSDWCDSLAALPSGQVIPLFYEGSGVFAGVPHLLGG